jgi:serine/threonine protein kinase
MFYGHIGAFEPKFACGESIVSEESASALPISAQFGAGSKIAGYVIEEKIGQGGMAVVFRAHDERLDRTVALKLLAPALAEDEAFRQRFIRESKAAAAVDDPHIIPVYDAGEVSGGLFIAMRFVRGGDVRSLLDRTGPLPADRAVAIVSQAASALDSAHARGLVHRDVKPANMLLDRDTEDDRPDHVYLSDFGLSKLSLQSTGLTDTGTFLGTLDYIAPEQIEGKPVDGRADQYSLACAAFELLTGSTPFRREDRQELMAVMYAQLSEPPPALSARRPDLAAAADHVFARALAKVAADRYRTCREFTSALRGALGLAPSQLPSAPIARPFTEAIPLAAMPAAAAGVMAGTPPPQQYQPYAVTSGPTAAPPTPPPVAYDQLHRNPRPPGRQRLTPVLLIVASVLVAAGIVGGALVFRSHNSPGAASGGGHTPNASSGSGNTTPNATGSTQPQAQGSPSAPASGDAPQLGSGGYQLVNTLRTGSLGLTAVSWNSSGSLVASSDKGGGTYLWSVPSGQPAGSPFSGPGQAYAAAVSPDGTLLAVGYSTGATSVWNLRSREVIGTLQDPGSSAGKEVDSVAFSPDGRVLVTSDGNGRINLWHLSSGQIGGIPTSLRDPAGSGVLTATFSSQGTLATGDYAGNVYLWSGDSTTASFLLPGAVPVSALAFSTDGSVLAAGNKNGYAELWSVANHSGAALSVPAAGSGQPIWGLSFNSARLLAMADNNGQSYLYRVNNTNLSATLDGTLSDPSSGTHGVGELGFSPDGRYLVTADTNGNAYVWHLG